MHLPPEVLIPYRNNRPSVGIRAHRGPRLCYPQFTRLYAFVHPATTSHNRSNPWHGTCSIVGATTVGMRRRPLMLFAVPNAIKRPSYRRACSDRMNAVWRFGKITNSPVFAWKRLDGPIPRKYWLIYGLLLGTAGRPAHNVCNVVW